MTIQPSIPPVFAFQCQEVATFDCSKEVVYAALHRVAEWPKYLAHVLSIDVLYDDGQYQEFLMSVDSRGDLIKVRSVRNCKLDLIEFFQPVPPVFLVNHGGYWQFYSTGADSCEVRVTHMWNIKTAVAEQQFPATAEQTTEQQVAELLAEHSRLALQRWQTALNRVKPSEKVTA